MSSLSLLPSQREMGARVRLRGPCLSPHRGGRRSLAVREASALGRILGVGLYVLRRRRGPAWRWEILPAKFVLGV